ncbi:MAG TPA: cupin domain-containing protein [Pyrinomonadaceae bacterium]|nr:cupin domain-containing protein [Pyrinomonadaceae bacterium]
MAMILEGGCRVSDMRDGEPLAQESLRIWNQIGRQTGAQAISLRIMEFAPGLSPGIRNGDCDEILYVLNSERGSERDSERGHPVRPSEHSERTPNLEVLGEIFINGHLYDLPPDTGIYIRPHETFSINNPGPGQIVIVSSQCPDPDRKPQFVTPLTVPSTDSAPTGQRSLVRLADRRAQPTADRWYRVLVDDEVGSGNATQFVGSIPPGRAPNHFHHYEEVLFILKGEGRMWAGETNTPIAAGSCIYLPKGQVHCVENTGTGELRLLGVFYPAGSPSVRYDV